MNPPKMNQKGAIIEEPDECPKLDSGLMSLSIIASYHRKFLDHLKVSHEFGKNSQRLTQEELILAARRNDFRARQVNINISELGRIPLPAIAMRRDGSYFVFAKRKDGHNLIQIPGKAPEVWQDKMLLSQWTGALILLSHRPKKDDGDFTHFGINWFWKYAAKFKSIFGEMLFISLVIQLFGLITPLFFQVVVDKVLVHKGLTTLDVLLVGLLSVYIFEAALSYIRTYLFAHTASRLDVILGSKVFTHLLSLPIAYFGSRATGQTVARIRELENIRQFLTSSAMTLTVDLLFSIIFIFVMLSYSNFLTLIVLSTFPLYIILTLVLTPIIRQRVDEKFRQGSLQQSFVVESLAGVETIKAMAIEPQTRLAFDERLASYVTASFKVVSLAAAGSQAIQIIAKFTTAALLWFGAHAVINGEMSIGALVAFNMLAGQVNQPIIRMAQLWQDFQQFKLSVDRLGDILNTQTEITNTSARHDLPRIGGTIELEDVHFRYKPDTPEILRGIRFKINAGEVIGIVGRSGSGKSTVTKLIQRLYTPERGKILIDGSDVALMNPAWLRRQIGVVLQENVLFARSVRENIALANPGLQLESVIDAAKLAGAHDFIVAMTHGYDTILEERGTNLSGGQRQRIAIARALANKPTVLIFDEATSALDYESEQAIQNNMRSICLGRTVIIIAHRLSTVRNADRIIVLDQGTLAEEGSHDELIRVEAGIYASLISSSAG